MSDSNLYIREGDTLRLQGKGSQYGWRIVKGAGEKAIPSPLGGISFFLPAVVGVMDGREKTFQQVSPKFWLMMPHE